MQHLDLDKKDKWETIHTLNQHLPHQDLDNIKHKLIRSKETILLMDSLKGKKELPIETYHQDLEHTRIVRVK